MADLSCFVIGPIGEAGSSTRKRSDFILKGIIKPALEPLGYKVKRADEDDRPGSISSNMIVDVLEADLVVADLTDFNPNAFYELGIRHAAHRPAIHLIAQLVHLPFDNQDQRTIFVDLADIDDIAAAKVRMAESAQKAQAPDFVVTNPVTQAKAVFALKESNDPRDEVIADLADRLGRVERKTALTEVRLRRSATSGILSRLADTDARGAASLVRAHQGLNEALGMTSDETVRETIMRTMEELRLRQQLEHPDEDDPADP